MSETMSLSHCLFYTVADPENVKPQSYQALWEIREGVAWMDRAHEWKEAKSISAI